jgi:hypothetical protein
MNFLKSLFKAIVGFTIGPFLALPTLKNKPIGNKLLAFVDCATRITVVASFFLAVPAVALYCAIGWLVFEAAFITVSLCLGHSFLSAAVEAVVKQDEAPVDKAPV